MLKGTRPPRGRAFHMTLVVWQSGAWGDDRKTLQRGKSRWGRMTARLLGLREDKKENTQALGEAEASAAPTGMC